MIPVNYNVRSLLVRKVTTSLSALGVALVVFVLAASLMLADSIKRTLGKSGSPDTALVLRKGNDAELSSTIDDPQVGLILGGPGVKKDSKGAPLGVAEVVVVVAMDKLGTDGVSNVQVRGVGDNVTEFRPGVRILAGRPARPGTDEAIVGRRIRGRFRGLDVGQTFELRKNRPLTVVGVFEDDGSSFESEVWMDRDTLRATFGRQGGVSSVRVRLASPSQYEAFQAFVESDKQLGLKSFREPDYYVKQSEGTSLFVTAIGVIIAFLFSLGAMILALVTMHASIGDRQREIGTLRALGFSRGAVIFAFLLEAVVLALVGGAIGVAMALAMQTVKFSMINFQSWSEMVFTFHPTPAILLVSLLASAVMGLLGGLYPAVRAARISPVQAMRG